MSNSKPVVCIILVNWNGWRDTQECINSLLKGSEQNFRIIVCDNNSTDGSLEQLDQWATDKQITHRTLSVHAAINDSGLNDNPVEKLLFVPTGGNLGFAGGCNIGLRHVMVHSEYSHAWLLNNDTIVDSDCLESMLEASQEDQYDRPIGNKIFDLDGDKKLQVYGGQKLGTGPLVHPRHCQRADNIDYLVGASIFISRARLFRLGLMEEDFFLNAEDLAYTLTYKREFIAQHPDQAPFLVTGRLWHRESSTQGQNKFLHSYYYSRNLLHIARREGLLSFIITGGHALLRIIKALLLLRFSAAKGIGSGILHALLKRHGAYSENTH